MAVVISSASSEDLSAPGTKTFAAVEPLVVSASTSGELLADRSRSGAKFTGSESPPAHVIPFATRTSLVDESDDEKKQQSPSTSAEFPAVVVNDGKVSTPPRYLSKVSASAEYASKRESVFTPRERRRTATAFGDGELLHMATGSTDELVDFASFLCVAMVNNSMYATRHL